MAPVTPAYAGDTRYLYDESGRIIQEIGTAGDTTEYTYDPSGNLLSIKHKSATEVAITGFTPSGGVAGTSVTIQGRGFSATASQNTVLFNGTAASITSASSTQVIATVPAGATTGPITVTTPQGSATSSAAFIIAPTPTISGFTPTLGRPGTPVTITGTNFGATAAGNKISFNTTSAVVTAASTTSIGTKVPSGAASGRIAVATAAGKAVSNDDFFIVPGIYATAEVGYTGRMAIDGPTHTVSLNTTNKIALVVFDGTAGQRITLEMAEMTFGSAEVSILKPNGTILASGTVTQPGGYLEDKTLALNGSYTILVDPVNGAAGSVKLRLYGIVDVTGQITIAGPPVSVTTTIPGQNARLTFSGTAGQQVNFFTDKNTITGQISILGPTGAVLISAPVNANNVYTEFKPLPTTGTYTVLIDPAGINTGGTSISLGEIRDFSAPITIGGPSVTVPFTTPGQRAKLLFSGTAGQVISVAATGGTLASGSLSLVGPAGESMASASITNGRAYIDRTVLPTTGTYTVWVDPAGDQTGNVTLAVYNANDVVVSAAIGGSPVTVPIAASGRIGKVTFSATAGQMVSIAVTGGTITSGSVHLRDPSGAIVAGTNVSISNGKAYIDRTVLSVAGTYTLWIDPASDQTGSATVTVYDASDVVVAATIGGPAEMIPITVSDITVIIPFVRQAVTVPLTVPGRIGKVTFTAAASQVVSIAVTGGTVTSGSVDLRNPSGAVVAGTSVSISDGKAYIDRTVLSVAGTYTLWIDPASDQTGNVTVAVYDAGDTVVSAAIGGPAVAASINVPYQQAVVSFTAAAGQVISPLLTSSTITSGYFYLYSPTGAQLTYAQISNGSAALGRLVLGAGTYTLRIVPNTPVTGSASVTIHNAADTVTTATIGGPAVTASINVPYQQAVVSFTAAAGQAVSVSLTGGTITAGSVTLLRPDGLQIAWASIGSNGTAFIDRQVLSVAGTYSVVINATGNMTGSATVAVHDATDVVVAATIGGAAEMIPITVSDITVIIPFVRQAVTVSITVPGQNGRITFSGTAGQAVSVTLSSTFTSGRLDLLQPDGSLLRLASIGANGVAFIDQLVLPTTGSYTLLLNPEGNATGSATIAVYDASDVVVPATVGGPGVTVPINIPGQNGKVTFSAVAGQPASISLTSASFTSGVLTLVDPTGATIVSRDLVNGAAFIDQMQLAAGTYTVLFNPTGSGTGSATIVVHNASDAVVSTTVGGPAVTAAITIPGQKGKVTFDAVANQAVSVAVTGGTITSGNLWLYDPNGQSVLIEFVCCSGGTMPKSVPITNGTAYIDRTVLTTAGTYSLVIDPPGNMTGTVTVVVHGISDTVVPITIGGPPITASIPVPGQTTKLTFNAAANQAVSIALTGGTITDGNLWLYDPNGQSVLTQPVCCSGGTMPKSVPITNGTAYIDRTVLSTVGTYTLLLDPSVAQTGSSTVRVYNADDLVLGSAQ